MTSSKSLPRPTKNTEELKKKAATEALWKKGIIHWKLDKNQLEIREAVLNSQHTKIVVASSRQSGKSWGLAAIAIELCIQNPEFVVKYVAPKVKDIKNVVLHNVRDIMRDCPKELVPKFSKQDSIFTFHNGSMIQLAAAENGHIDGIRGTRANLCIVDEAGFCSDLDYAIDSVLLPTITTTDGKIVIASTPARAPDHDFVRIMNEAESEGRLIRKTIYDNPRLSKEQIQKLIDACGGEHTVQFRREYMAQNIINEDDAVVPEFSPEMEEKIVQELQRPSHFDAYVSADWGGRDFTAILFAYYDFTNARLVIEDELLFKGKEIITDNIAAAIKMKEESLYRNPMTGEVKEPYMRIADNNNIILLNDLAVKHKLSFVATLKDNRDAAINNMRLLIKNQRIYINPRCKQLINHLKSAIWKKNGKEFARSAENGHYDLLDALIYLCRNVDFQKNPFPAGYGFNGYKDMAVIEQPKATTEFERKLEDQFKVRKVGVRRRF